MAVKWKSIDQPSDKGGNGPQPAAAGFTESEGRGEREDGSGSTTPRDRKSLAASGAVPSRQLNIRSR